MSHSIEAARDPYRAVIQLLFAAAIAGSAGAFVLFSFVDNPVLPDLVVACGLAAGCLFGVAQSRRPQRPAADPAPTDDPEAATIKEKLDLFGLIRHWIDQRGNVGAVVAAVGSGGLLALVIEWTLYTRYDRLSIVPAVAGAAACAAGAALVATAVHYLHGIDPAGLPESEALARAGRVLAWMLVGAGLSMGLLWAQQPTAARVVHTAAMLINVAVCYGLLSAKPAEREGAQTFPLDLGVLSVLGSRPNIAREHPRRAERQLGIDLRSTWALTVVRRSVEPLVDRLCVGRLALDVADGRRRRRAGPRRAPRRAGRRPAAPAGPSSALAVAGRSRVSHSRAARAGADRRPRRRGRAAGPKTCCGRGSMPPNEYTLLLGNGRDLITVDAAVQFRIADARAWRYHSQNPARRAAAIAYRAVMRTTVNRTLAEALSENLVTTTARMRAMVQQDADALGLGVEVLGLHGRRHAPAGGGRASTTRRSCRRSSARSTAVVNAQAFRNRTVPARRDRGARRQRTRARAEGAERAGAGGGRSVELPHAAVAVSRRARGVLLPAPARDAREGARRRGASRSWTAASSGMEVSCG